jgi:hypothetical protein
VTEVRELLDSTAAAVAEPDEVPLDAVLAAGRRRVRRRRWTVSGAGAAVALAVLAVALPIARDPGGLPGTVKAVTGGGGDGAAPVSPAPTGSGDARCGDVRFDRSKLPGRTVTVDGDWPTARAADLLDLHGWPRAVPFDAARWTEVTDGRAGVLVAFLPGTGYRYLPVQKGAGGAWVVGPPCTPR